MQRLWNFIKEWCIYFFIYAVLGWIYEVFLEVVIYRWGYSDRGVLLGPYCPVYGFGAVIFILCFRSLMKKGGPKPYRILKPFLIFLGCMLVATAIELLTSYILEALIGSWPWQTYTDYKINFQGRIALSPSIRFGLGGLLILYFLQPFFERMVSRISLSLKDRITVVLLVLLLIDCAVTVFIN